MAGLAATIPMTIGMVLMQRFLPNQRKKRLPPVEITDRLTQKIEPLPDLEPPALLTASLVNHFAYGSAMGVLYTLTAKRVPGSSIVKGSGFGLLVWLANYLGLMPKMGLYPHARNEPARMNALMIVSHLVWGGTTGIVSQRLSRSITSA